MTEAQLVSALKAKGLSDIAVELTEATTRVTYQRRNGERGADAVFASGADAMANLAKYAG